MFTNLHVAGLGLFLTSLISLTATYFGGVLSVSAEPYLRMLYSPINLGKGSRKGVCNLKKNACIAGQHPAVNDYPLIEGEKQGITKISVFI